MMEVIYKAINGTTFHSIITYWKRFILFRIKLSTTSHHVRKNTMESSHTDPINSLSKGEAKAFTLIEMVIAITVFSIFLGFVIGVYLSFHRAQQDTATERSLLMDGEAAMTVISDALRTYRVDYEEYGSLNPWAGDVLSAVNERDYLFDSASYVMEESVLYLEDVDGVGLSFMWDQESETLSVVSEGADGASDGNVELLHADDVQVTYASFEIFPDENPYDAANVYEDDLQFQPIVKVRFTFAKPGRFEEEVSLDFETSVTSRFYQ
jgi:prepilin-type N-terminal cleavage/methylation domain-containing protein